MCLELCKGIFDRIEIGAIGRQIAEFGTTSSPGSSCHEEDPLRSAPRAAAAHAGGLAVGATERGLRRLPAVPARRATTMPGAAWHHPAALADGGGLRVGFSLALAHPSLAGARRDGTWSADTESKWSTPPHLDASYARDRWAAGIAIGVPFGGGVTWPTTWPGATQAVRTELMVIRAAPFAAYSFGRCASPAGVHFDAGRLQIQRNLDFIDMEGDVRLDLARPGRSASTRRCTASRAATSASASPIAAARRSASTATRTSPRPTRSARRRRIRPRSTTMTMPDQIVLGARWRRGALTALADLEYTLWSVNQRTDRRLRARRDAERGAAERLARHAHGARRRRVAARRSSSLARGGYFDPSPVPAEHLTPSSPDATRVAATAGASWRFSPAWSADVFGEHMWLLRRDTTSVDTMPASYGGTAIVLGAGVRWTPGTRASVADILRPRVRSPRFTELRTGVHGAIRAVGTVACRNLSRVLCPTSRHVGHGSAPRLSRHCPLPNRPAESLRARRPGRRVRLSSRRRPGAVGPSVE